MSTTAALGDLRFTIRYIDADICAFPCTCAINTFQNSTYVEVTGFSPFADRKCIETRHNISANAAADARGCIASRLLLSSAVETAFLMILDGRWVIFAVMFEARRDLQ